MKSHKSILSRVIQAAERQPNIFVPDVILALKGRYSFVDVPSVAEDILANPLTLRHGKFVNNDGLSVVLDTLAIYPEAVVIDVASTTDDGEQFLDDLIGWAWSAPDEANACPPRRRFISHIEAELDFQLDALPGFKATRRFLASSLKDYDGSEHPPAVGIHAIGLSTDLTAHPIACDFRLERRNGFAFSANVYFSQAPLRTLDHVEALEAFEEDAKELIAIASNA